MKSDFHLLHLPVVDSTNSYLKAISEVQSFDEPVMVIADEQTEGRGQWENKWHSKPNKNLLSSILIQEDIPIENSFYLSMITALSLYNLLIDEVEDNLWIKWTNDLYYHDKKIAGILIDNTMKGDKIIRSIIGIGLNLNETNFPNELPNPVSLKQITGKSYDVENFGIKLYNKFQSLFFKFQQGFHHIIINDYNRYLYKKNEWVKIHTKSSVEIVKILSVSPLGYLIIEKKTGEKKQFAYGEAKIII